MLRVLALSLATLFATQASAQSIVGQWDCNGRDGANQAIRTLQQYRASGAFYHLANMATARFGQRFDIAIALQGNWSADRDILIEDITTARVRSITSNGQDVMATPAGKRMARFIRQSMTNRSRVRLTSLTDTTMSFGGRIKASCTKR